MFPFLSGDTYRSVCDVVIESEADLAALSNVEAGSLVFSSVEMVGSTMSALGTSAASQVRLIVHNGDELPSELLAAQARRFERVFAVNWMGSRELVEPLPIGLENAWLGVNGVWALFHDCVAAKRDALVRRARTREVLVAFSDHTCPDVRTPARTTFLESGLDIDAPTFMSPSHYHSRLRDSLFVPSPRGNGIDCHRTWEAIYTGAVPVVLRRDWAFEHLQLPVLVVDEWADAVRDIQHDARGLYAEVQRSSAQAAYALHALPGLLGQS